jgi:hypothetical protein
VPHRVAQRLLHDPVRGQVHALREGPGSAADPDGDRHPASAGRFEQTVGIVEAGLGRGVRLVAAQHPQHAAQFAETAERAGADPGEALGQFLRRVSDLVGSGLGLDGDHRHVVGDDVMQLAGDALALLEQRALALVAPFGDLQLLAAAAPGANDEAGEDAGCGHEDRGDQGRRVDDGGAEHGHDAGGDHDP